MGPIGPAPRPPGAGPSVNNNNNNRAGKKAHTEPSIAIKDAWASFGPLAEGLGAALAVGPHELTPGTPKHLFQA